MDVAVGSRIRKTVAAAAVAALAASLLGACGSGSDGAKAEAKTASKTQLTSEQLAWAADYIHGKAGTKATGKPITIGLVNQEGGTFDFKEGTIAAKATADFINDELGGIDGAPIKLHTCAVASPDDVQKCGTELANDSSIKAVIAPALYISNGVFYKALNGKYPIIMNSLVFPEDFTTPNLFSYFPSGASSSVATAHYIADTLGLKKVDILRTDNDAGLAGFAAYKSTLEAMGVHVTDVAVPEPGTAPEYAGALAQAQVKKGDALIPVLTSLGCANVFDALRTAHLDVTVVAASLCAAAPVPERLKAAGQKNTAFPEGWYLTTNGYNYFDPQPNTNGVDVMAAVVKKYAGDNANVGGYSPTAFAELLNAVRFIQEAGGASATTDQIAAKAKAFTGPSALTAGDIACGAVPKMPNACAFSTGLSQFKGEKWVSVEDGTNGKALDTRSMLGS